MFRDRDNHSRERGIELYIIVVSRVGEYEYALG